MKAPTISGLYPATVTVFREDLTVDEEAVEQHIREIAGTEGVAGVVVNGGIGELLNLSLEEQAAIVEIGRKAVAPDQLLIAGIEARRVEDAIETGLAVKKAGAQALLVLPPFDVRAYKKLNSDRESVVGYFRALEEQVGLPIIIFQYPDHTGCAYSIDVLEALAELESVVAIKVAAERLEVYVPVWEALRDKIAVLAASDSPPLLEILAHGAHGAMIGISIIETPLWVELLRRFEEGQSVTPALESAVLHIMDGVFENQKREGLIGDAAASKEALFQLGKIPSARVRWPAKHADANDKSKIRSGLLGAGLLRVDDAAF